MRYLSIFFIFINFLFGFDLNEFAKDVADKSYIEIDINNTKKRVNIQLKKGWNLVNLPLYEIIRDKKRFGDYKAIWIYKNGEYITPKYPKAGEPFWIYSNSDIEIENIGRSYNIDLSALPIGWNIVGNGSEISSIEIENYSNIYWVYRDNGYIKNPSIIYPNEGFYIKIDEELKALNSSKKDEIVDFKSAFNYNFSDIKKDKNKKLIILYMVGSDLESSYKSATKDLIELSDGYKSLTEAQKKTVEIIVVFGGSKATNWNGLHIASIEDILRDSENKKFGDDKYLFSDEKLNMGEINTLTTLLKELKNFDDYKSKTIIFWNHGGAYFGYGDDNNFKDKLTIEEIEIAFKRADMSFDMIGFDACLMANYEVATILKPYTKYLIASEETEPGHGWNWEFLIQQFSKDIDLESFGKSVIDNYVDDKNYKTVKKGKTLSMMDLSHYDE